MDGDETRGDDDDEAFSRALRLTAPPQAQPRGTRPARTLESLEATSPAKSSTIMPIVRQLAPATLPAAAASCVLVPVLLALRAMIMAQGLKPGVELANPLAQASSTLFAPSPTPSDPPNEPRPPWLPTTPLPPPPSPRTFPLPIAPALPSLPPSASPSPSPHAPPTPLAPPPPLPRLSVMEVAAAVNRRFREGRPSNDLAEAGVLLHCFDGYVSSRTHSSPAHHETPSRQ